ncbi:MAG: metallophosphoesterase [Deltaproteobacteria bacterium]|nr:metallophosphoesterase [Deltaproteobacteria bacterium]
MGTRFQLEADGASASGRIPRLPVEGAKTPFTFAVVGDARDHAKWAELARSIAEKQPRFVIDTGDNVESDKPADWRDYYVAGQSLFANVPVFAARGNHDSGGTYAEYNPAPSTGIGPSTYAFTYGNAGFLALDSNDATNPKQLDFAAKALNAMSGGPLFVFQHHPLYSCGTHGNSEKMQTAFQSLFEKAHVTVDFAGHDHDLIEWKPVNGVRYVVSGGGGTVTYPLFHCDGQPFAKQSFGFVLVTVEGPKVSMKFFDEHGIELHATPPFDALGPSVPAVDLTKLTAH